MTAMSLRQDYHSPRGGDFDRDSLARIAIGDFYRNALGTFKTRQNRQGWAQAECPSPSHHSKSHRSFSVNLRTGAFKCWGCDGRGGDLVDFVKWRDRCDFKTAARRLGCWTDSTWAGRAAIAEAWRETQRLKAEKQAKAEAEKRQRLTLRDELHAAQALYDELSSRLSGLKRGADPAYEDEKQYILDLLPLALTDVRLSDAAYCQAAGLEVG
jgi:CHC2 zinc finger